MLAQAGWYCARGARATERIIIDVQSAKGNIATISHSEFHDKSHKVEFMFLMGHFIEWPISTWCVCTVRWGPAGGYAAGQSSRMHSGAGRTAPDSLEHWSRMALQGKSWDGAFPSCFPLRRNVLKICCVPAKKKSTNYQELFEVGTSQGCLRKRRSHDQVATAHAHLSAASRHRTANRKGRSNLLHVRRLA